MPRARVPAAIRRSAVALVAALAVGVGTAAAGSRTVYTRPVRARLAAIIAAHPDLTYAELVPLVGADPALRDVARWTKSRIDALVSRYPDDFGSRRAAYTAGEISRVVELAAEHPDWSYARLASAMAAEPRRGPNRRWDRAVVRKLLREGGAPPRSNQRYGAGDRERIDALLAERPEATLVDHARRLATAPALRGLDVSFTDTSLRRLLARYPGEFTRYRAARAEWERATAAQRTTAPAPRRAPGAPRTLTLPSIASALTPAQRARVARAIADHPELGYRELADRFAADPALAAPGTSGWSADAISRLVRAHPEELPPRFVAHGVDRDEIRALALAHPAATPGQLARRMTSKATARSWRAHVIAEVLAEGGGALERERTRRVRAGLIAQLAVRRRQTVDEIVAAMHAAGFDGFIDAQLWRLVAADAGLARALERHLLPAAAPPPTPLPAIGIGAARRVREDGGLIAATVARVLPATPLFASWMQAIAALERTAGNADGVLTPRDAEQAAPALRPLLDALYARGGRKRLTLADVAARLPAAAARIEPAAQPALFTAIAIAVLGHLADGYRREVTLGLAAPDDFRRAHHLVSRAMPFLSERYARQFGRTKHLTRAQLADAYRALMARELTAWRFYQVTGLTNDGLRLLRLIDPEHFPPFDGEVRRSVRGTRRRFDEAELALLGARWRDEVATRRMTQVAFSKETGVPLSLIGERRDLFPRTGHARQRPPGNASEMARAISDLTAELIAADVLTELPDLLARANGDADFVVRFGLLTPPRYFQRVKLPDAVTLPHDGDQIAGRLLDEARAIVAAGAAPPTKAELFAELGRRHPRFGKGYWVRMRALDPGFFASLAAKREGPRPPKSLAHGLAMRTLARLLVRLHPPGTRGSTALAPMVGVAARRGLELSAPWRAAALSSRGEADLVADEQAAVLAELLAEYADASAPEAGHDAIVGAALADYPTLGRADVDRAMARVAAAPDRYPALARHRDGGAVRLRGGGARPADPRYLGGFDPRRAVLDNPALAGSLLRTSEMARMPLRLPLVEEVLARVGGRPLRNKNLLWISHLQATTPALADAVTRAGAPKAATVLVGTPYGSNPAARDALRDMGYDVRVPPLSTAAYRAEVARALDDVVARYRDNREPIVVMDDGGLVASILHDEPARYADVMPAIRIVEQTTRGITLAERYRLGVPVIAAALADSKKEEAATIGRSVAGKALQALRRRGGTLEGKTVVVMGGGGATGSAIARAVADQVGAHGRVIVVEPSAARAKAAARRFDVMDKAAALPLADVVIGASGERSVALADLERLRDGAMVLSASSKQDEIDMDGLAGVARREVLPAAHPLVRLPDARYHLAGRTLTVLGDGWPINFDGDVEDIAPEEIQLTRALMLAGAIQAARLGRGIKRGVIPFDPDMDRWLLGRFRDLRRGQPLPAIGDPTRWREPLVALAREAGLLP